MRPAQILWKIELFRMEALGPEAARFIEWDARVVADIHGLVVNPGRPLAGEINLCAGQTAREHHQEESQNKSHRGSSTRHGVGSHPELSGSFLKCAWVMSGSMRYCGSVTTAVTASQVL